MLSCKHLVEQASEYIDDEMSAGKKIQVKLHLFMCVSCRRYLKQLKLTMAMLGRKKNHQASEEMCYQLLKEYQKNLPKQGS
ncbi:anti-sigma factor family protein [Kangiella koreensis]|uniref:Putative transmembrane anti-sigma factor n=1 Tax=Kangiella koreensis (strain DSM 16069 / JCM 12317 / KCTC 12182 / SW-125) TaxID=523791 RepID=C7R964_KANKD|nr:zf-HC2 domain-containing protein [Kangiella koreensis]ACV27854.1 putative transmembrane anti-sigma factor [Kangiella koreensis DSM 16069]